MNRDFANMDIQTYRNFEYSRLREMGVMYGPEVLFEERVIENPICATRLLFYRPLHSEDMILPVFINLHGGGFVLGYPEVDDPYCRLIAREVHCLVVNVDYALAPEYQFPKGIENVYGVVKWLYMHADELHIDPRRIAIGGHSAGGNIAAATCLLAKERQEFSLVYQILDYAPLDLATDPSQKGEMTTDEVLIGLQNLARKYNAWYLPKREDAHTSPSQDGVEGRDSGTIWMGTDDWDRVMRYPPCGKRLNPARTGAPVLAGFKPRVFPGATRRSKPTLPRKLGPQDINLLHDQ